MASSAINLSETGPQKATIKVKSLEPKGKLTVVEIEGSTVKLKFWNSAAEKFAQPIAVGAEAEVEIDVKAGNYGNEGFIQTFGGPNKGGGGGQQRGQGGGGGGGRAFMPKTPEEVHSASVAGIVKTAMETAAKLGDALQVEDLTKKIAGAGIRAYVDGLAAIIGNRPAPAVEAKTEGDPRAKEAGDYFRSPEAGGTKDDWAELLKVCREGNFDHVDLILKGRDAGNPASKIIADARIKATAGKAEPGPIRDSTRASVTTGTPSVDETPAQKVRRALEATTDHEAAANAICAQKDWPTFGVDPVAWARECSRWLGRSITKPTQLTEHDRYRIHEALLRIVHGIDDVPFAFHAHANAARLAREGRATEVA